MPFTPTATPSRPPADRNWLPRLHKSHYQADAVVMWTLPINNRATGWLTTEFHHTFREHILHAAAREHLLTPVYVLMPDHLHLVWIGLRADSDQRNAMTFLRRYVEPHLTNAKFQVQSHDHVFKPEERKPNAFMQACQYILLNPVRANLVSAPADWPFSGCIIPGYPDLHPLDQTYWEKFWRLFAKMRDPNCDRHVKVWSDDPR